jgi:DNA-binding transcriptional LysR family regulator
MNRLTALRAFVATVDHGSFAAAARALGVSAAGVSKNVRELEADLGVRLFHRTTRAMALTDEGALYHERMRVLLAEMDEVDAAVTEVSSQVRGRLRVTAPMSVGLLRLAPLVPAFLSEHPGVTLDLHLDDEKDDLIHGGFDLAIRGTGKLPDSTLIARRLASLDHVMIASPAYLDAHGAPDAPEDLRDRSCLLYTNAPRPDRWTLRHAVNGTERTIPVRGPLTANNSLVLREAVLSGTGIASMPRLYVEEDIAAGRIAVVMADWTPPALSVWAISPPGPTVLPRVRLFIDFLARHLRGFEAMTPEAVEVASEVSSQD